MCFKSLINVKYYICAKAWSQKEVAVNHFNTNRKEKKKISYFFYWNKSTVNPAFTGNSSTNASTTITVSATTVNQNSASTVSASNATQLTATTSGANNATSPLATTSQQG